MEPLPPKMRPAQGIACLRARSKWLVSDIKEELDEVLSSSEFRALRFEIDQIKMILLQLEQMLQPRQPYGGKLGSPRCFNFPDKVFQYFFGNRRRNGLSI